MDYNKNYYQILGVDKKASQDEIKKTFRKLAKEQHPDKGGDQEKFKQINEANGVLSDEKKRLDFDTKSQFGANPRQNNPFGGGSKHPFEDIFGGGFDNSFMENFMRQSSFQFREEMFENLDITISVNITLEEIYNNVAKTVSYERNIPCNSCNSSGTSNNSKCEKCQGNKVIKEKQNLPLSNLHFLQDIPQTLRQDGFGNVSKYNNRRYGNLLIKINPIQNPAYERNGKDLYHKIGISFKTAVLGGEYEYKHLDNKTYKITIPPKTQNGTKFSLKEKGMPFNYGRGTLFIVVEIKIDFEKLDALDLQLIEQISI